MNNTVRDSNQGHAQELKRHRALPVIMIVSGNFGASVTAYVKGRPDLQETADSAETVLARLALGGHRIAAVAHRVVHGGAKYFDPVRVDAAVLADLKTYIPLAPLHQPFALEAIETLLATAPGLPQVACFDTAFHHTLPRWATITLISPRASPSLSATFRAVLRIDRACNREVRGMSGRPDSLASGSNSSTVMGSTKYAGTPSDSAMA